MSQAQGEEVLLAPIVKDGRGIRSLRRASVMTQPYWESHVKDTR
jgi:hypothetical protein